MKTLFVILTVEVCTGITASLSAVHFKRMGSRRLRQKVQMKLLMAFLWLLIAMFLLYLPLSLVVRIRMRTLCDIFTATSLTIDGTLHTVGFLILLEEIYFMKKGRTIRPRKKHRVYILVVLLSLGYIGCYISSLVESFPISSEDSDIFLGDGCLDAAVLVVPNLLPCFVYEGFMLLCLHLYMIRSIRRKILIASSSQVKEIKEAKVLRKRCVIACFIIFLTSSMKIVYAILLPDWSGNVYYFVSTIHLTSQSLSLSFVLKDCYKRSALLEQPTANVISLSDVLRKTKSAFVERSKGIL